MFLILLSKFSSLKITPLVVYVSLFDIFIVKFDDSDEEEKKQPSITKSQTVKIEVESEKSQKDAELYLASKFKNIDKDKPYRVEVQGIARNPNFIRYISESINDNWDTISFSNSDGTDKTNSSAAEMLSKHFDYFKDILNKPNCSISIELYQNVLGELEKINNMINDGITMKVNLDSEQQQVQSDLDLTHNQHIKEGTDCDKTN